MADTANRGEDARAAVRRAGPEDAETVARLLRDFNTEFDEPTPELDELSARYAALIGSGELTVLLVGGGPWGFAQLRFLETVYSNGLSAYLEELYVAPAHRGNRLGRALMDAATDLARERGADRMDLNTAETDVAARALYESLGFTNHEGSPDGPRMLYYERDL